MSELTTPEYDTVPSDFARMGCETQRINDLAMEGGREMSERPTPETDAETNYCDAMPNMPWVDAEVSRHLERERDEAREAIIATLEENRHLADGDDCTLAKLKSVVPEWK